MLQIQNRLIHENVLQLAAFRVFAFSALRLRTSLTALLQLSLITSDSLARAVVCRLVVEKQIGNMSNAKDSEKGDEIAVTFKDLVST